jgi:hypothetical protein
MPYRGSSTAQGYGAGWRKISDRVRAEEPVCPGYERPCGDPTSVVDHIQSRRSGGPSDRANLRAYSRGTPFVECVAWLPGMPSDARLVQVGIGAARHGLSSPIALDVDNVQLMVSGVA